MRRAGVGAIRDKHHAQDRYKAKGEEILDTQLSHLTRQVDKVKSALEEFAAKHRTQIKNNAKFRGQFQAMCASIGVDPLAYSRGCWSEVLGLGEFYYHLAVRIIEVCMANEKRTGGIIPLQELLEKLNKNKSIYVSEITQDDAIRSIKKLHCLGDGFSLIQLKGGGWLVRSVPGEMNMDQTMLLELAETTSGRILVSECIAKCGWTEERARAAILHLVKEGMAWVDDADPVGERSYWLPSLHPVVASPISNNF